jgi:hypothetical protein
MTQKERDTANFTTYEKRVIYELTSIKGSIWGFFLVLMVYWYWR